MRGAWRAAVAHRVPMALGATAAAVLVVWFWPRVGVTVDMFYPRPARGVSVAEMVGVLLSAFLPALAVTSYGVHERRCSRAARIAVLTGWALTPAVLGLVPFLAWYVRVHQLNLGSTPQPLPFVGTLLVYGAVGLLLTQLLGPVAGSVSTLALFAGLVVLQNHQGAGVLFRTMSTGDVWQTRWPLVLLVLATAAVVSAWLRGATRRPLSAVRDR